MKEKHDRKRGRSQRATKKNKNQITMLTNKLNN
jgi:hypothetical protein